MFLLLTGAGFSHNWGGWLADEAFEYLIGSLEIDDNIRHLLWERKIQGGGFEDAISQLQEEYNRSRSAHAGKQLSDLQTAVVGMFNHMDQAFARTTFEPQNDIRYMVRTFLVRFDAIFTLNQDLLLERHYLDDNISLSSGRKWDGYQIPGTKALQDPGVYDPVQARVALRTPIPSDFTLSPRLQPYFKLHGSSNWIDQNTGRRIFIMGGNKAVEINQHPILNWYHQQFRAHLLRPDTRLMVVGYSFGDHHINELIGQAADSKNLKLFIIDPKGVDVLDKQNPHAPLRIIGPLLDRLERAVVGASRRPLRSTFGSDRVEHDKVMRFFSI